MSGNSPTRHYQKNQRKDLKKHCERHQNLSAKNKPKTKNMVANEIEIYQNIKNNG